MLPDFWTDSKVGEPGSKSSGSRKYVSILLSKHPRSVPELMAYIIGIVRARKVKLGLLRRRQLNVQWRGMMT